MAQQAKVQLLLELKERIKTGITQAKNVVSRSTAEMKDKISGFKARFTGAFNEMKNSIPGFNRAVELIKNPITIISMSILALIAVTRKLSAALNRCIDDYKIQAEAETKLGAVMRNTMNASANEISAIKKLAAEQQRLGVISDGIQLSGAQELSTYLTKSASLKKLMPVMNDMIAQQYGLNATQEQAVNIASMMGKVMDGQVGALSRYGYKFDEAQAKILKYGNEAQRAATLAEVITSSVGGLNAALAQTPEGKLKQYANDMVDIRERFGAVFIAIKGAWMPVYDGIRTVWTRIVTFFENNKEKITQVITYIANTIVSTLRWIWNAIGTVINFFRGWWQAVQDGQPIIVAITAVVAGMTAVTVGYKVAIAAATVVTKLWAAAVGILNLTMWKNPVTWIIALVIALGAAIYYVATKTTGWGKTWGNIMTWIRLTWQQAGEGIKLIWLQVENSFLTGFEAIKMGWYKIKAFFGSESALAEQDAIRAARAERQKAINEQYGKMQNIKQAKEELKIWEVKVENTTLAETRAKLNKALGIGDAPEGSDITTPDGDEKFTMPKGNTEDATAGVTASARQVRNITVNIDAFNKGGINTQNTSMQNMDPSQIEDWFNQMLLRSIRNLELSM